MRLSVVEISAILFAAVAALASAAQAYLTYQERGEVARAIIFAERIEACTNLLSAIEPVVSKTTPAWIERISASSSGGREFRPAVFYFPQGTGSGSGAEAHAQMLKDWAAAKSAYLIVMPESARPRVAFFDRVVQTEIYDYNNALTKPEFIAWLTSVSNEAAAIADDCRSLV